MALYERFEVLKKVLESRNVVSLHLRSLERSELAPFKPGQHLLFRINVPGSEIPIFRYYSFSDSYDSRSYRISVKKECTMADGVVRYGRGSGFLFDTVKAGDVLEAKGPSGDFYLDPCGSWPVVLIGGGIGITPLLSMLKSVAQCNPERKVALFYGVNERSEHSFRQEINALKNICPQLRVFTFYNSPGDDDICGCDYDHQGFISVEKIMAGSPGANAQYYLCGPPGMMKYVTDSLVESGVPADQIHTESFTAAVDVADEERAASEPAVLEKSIAIEFNRSNKKLIWDSRYRSILEFAEAHDVEISSGCLFGDCGTCLTKIKHGKIKYTHTTLAQPDEGKCLPCSCVPATDLVLEA